MLNNRRLAPPPSRLECGTPAWIKRDDKGFIIDPENTDLKCGWVIRKRKRISIS